MPAATRWSFPARRIVSFGRSRRRFSAGSPPESTRLPMLPALAARRNSRAGKTSTGCVSGTTGSSTRFESRCSSSWWCAWPTGARCTAADSLWHRARPQPLPAAVEISALSARRMSAIRTVGFLRHVVCCLQPTVSRDAWRRSVWVFARYHSRAGWADHGRKTTVNVSHTMSWRTLSLRWTSSVLLTRLRREGIQAPRSLDSDYSATAAPGVIPRGRNPFRGNAVEWLPRGDRDVRASQAARVRAKRSWAKWPGCRYSLCRIPLRFLSSRAWASTPDRVSQSIHFIPAHRVAPAKTAWGREWPGPCTAVVRT